MVDGLELRVSFVHTRNEYRSAYIVDKQARLATTTDERETLVKRLCSFCVQYFYNFSACWFVPTSYNPVVLFTVRLNLKKKGSG